MDLLDGDVELTEFEAFEVESIKGVGEGANGFPILMMKGLALAKGAKDCPKCEKSYDADSQVENCENCGTKLPDPASKAADPKCKTCGDTGTILDGKRDCPDCDAKPKAASKAALAAVAKAVDASGAITQDPDIDLGHQIMKLLAQAIVNEAQEIGAGSYGETCDVDLLNSAASMINAWLSHEEAPGPADAGMGVLMDSAAIKAIVAEAVADELAKAALADNAADALGGVITKADLSGKAINDLPDSAFAHIEPGGTKDDEGKTTPRSLRHFPVHDKAHAQNALARLGSSPFGDKAKPKVMAAAKKFGIDVAEKSTDVAEGEAAVDTDAQGTGDLAKVAGDAVTKATEPLKAEIATLRGELAKVQAMPIPGGPVMSIARAPGGDGAKRTELVAKAAYYRAQAGVISDPGTAEGYRQKAREMEAEAAKLT